MSIDHIEVDSKGRLKRSLLLIDNKTIEININCLETYSRNPNAAATNKIASLFESYRRGEITPDKFEKEYLIQKEELKKRFIENLKIFDNDFSFYSFNSHNTLIKPVLASLKSECETFFLIKNIPFSDISNCLSKIQGAPTSNLQTFDSVLNGYNFYPDVLFDSMKNDYVQIDRLVIIDDVISKGKAIFALLKNLYDNNIITPGTEINANFIYCIEARYSNLLVKENIINQNTS
ncbi:MAG: hypothetical protein ACYDEE_12925 [Ignavibacteriaceae bacterium]